MALALVALLVIAVTGYGWSVTQGMTSGFAATDVLSAGAGGNEPDDGSRDILVVGMDSRTDAHGHPLSKEQMKLLRAGSDKGELNTDTLILLHIPNDGTKAWGLSIPRDSFVNIPGFGQHKINSAFQRAKTASKRQLIAQGVKDPAEIERRSNGAGARTLIATVEGLTGRTIDNYAAINLLGFYDITKAVGGVDVCLKHPVDDVKSHAKFRAGRQTVSGTSALAFVRQRHGLPRGDLDRVKRQQVFMASMVHKILSAGTLGSPGKLAALTDAVKKSVVLNSGWDLMGFAQQMSSLSGGDFKVQTIPVGSLSMPTPQDGVAVQVDPAKVRAFIQSFGGDNGDGGDAKPAPQTKAPKATVDVLNAGGKDGLAARVSDDLVSKGFAKGRVDSADGRPDTVIRHAPGDEASAESLAAMLPVHAVLSADSSLSAGQITVMLGKDYPANVPLRNAPPPKASPKASAKPKPSPSDGNGSSDGSSGPDGQDKALTAAGDVPCIN